MAVSHFKPQPNVNQSCEVKSSVISYWNYSDPHCGGFHTAHRKTLLLIII
jgi:hypothetical protein